MAFGSPLLDANTPRVLRRTWQWGWNRASHVTDKDTPTICSGSPQTGPSIHSEHGCWWPTWSSVSVSTAPHTLSYPGPLSAQADPITGDCEGGHSCPSAPVTAAAWTPCALAGEGQGCLPIFQARSCCGL